MTNSSLEEKYFFYATERMLTSIDIENIELLTETAKEINEYLYSAAKYLDIWKGKFVFLSNSGMYRTDHFRMLFIKPEMENVFYALLEELKKDKWDEEIKKSLCLIYIGDLFWRLGSPNPKIKPAEELENIGKVVKRYFELSEKPLKNISF